MGLSVSRHDARPVYPEHHIQIQKHYIIKVLVIRPLHESRVKGNDRLHAALCQSTPECDRMLLGHSDIEKSLFVIMVEELKACSVLHCGSYCAYPVVPVGKLRKGLSEYIGEGILRRVIWTIALAQASSYTSPERTTSAP